MKKGRGRPKKGPKLLGGEAGAAGSAGDGEGGSVGPKRKRKGVGVGEDGTKRDGTEGAKKIKLEEEGEEDGEVEVKGKIKGEVDDEGEVVMVLRK